MSDELAGRLRALHDEVDERLRAEWGRSLSFGDGLFDRWERANRLSFGSGSSIYNSAMVLEPVTVGANTWIGPWVMLDGSGGGISIGEWCSISAGVHIYTHDTVAWSLSGGAAARREGPVRIGDRCHVGAHSVLVAGVELGDQVVVGAGAVVTRDVPSRVVVAGVPAREIGHVEGQGGDVRVVVDPHRS